MCRWAVGRRLHPPHAQQLFPLRSVLKMTGDSNMPWRYMRTPTPNHCAILHPNVRSLLQCKPVFPMVFPPVFPMSQGCSRVAWRAKLPVPAALTGSTKLAPSADASTLVPPPGPAAAAANVPCRCVVPLRVISRACSLTAASVRFSLLPTHVELLLISIHRMCLQLGVDCRAPQHCSSLNGALTVPRLQGRGKRQW